ncbi:MAG: sulfate adenylyltransferase [Thermoplasmataceae archaeon]
MINSPANINFSAHGGMLINIPDVKDAEANHTVEVSYSTAIRIMNMKTGILSPLKGFMGENDLHSVMEEQRLENGIPWSIPYTLDIEEKDFRKVKEGDNVRLIHRSRTIAIMNVTGIYRYDRVAYCRKVFGTTSTAHPGVRNIRESTGMCLAGEIKSANLPEIPFMKETLFPVDTRQIFLGRGWKTVTGFQTRNVPHRGHEEMQRTALRVTDGIFINPVIGKKKPGDFRDEIIMESYKTLINNYYPSNRVLFSPLHYEMSYGGPREAMIHAIMRKNFGCTHFVVGRDHAGVGNFYGPYDAQKNLQEFDLGMNIMNMDEVFYCRKCEQLATSQDCSHKDGDRVHFSGTMVRNTLKNGLSPEAYLFRKEVYETINSHDNMFVN